MERPARTEPVAASRTVVYFDADGAVVSDPARAVGGEIVDVRGAGNLRRRSWFLIEEVELRWLPVSESTFLLWVLAFLAAAWVLALVFLYVV
jgi:hypothetical protein